MSPEICVLRGSRWWSRRSRSPGGERRAGRRKWLSTFTRKRSRPIKPIVDIAETGMHIANGVTDMAEIIVQTLLHPLIVCGHLSRNLLAVLGHLSGNLLMVRGYLS